MVSAPLARVNARRAVGGRVPLVKARLLAVLAALSLGLVACEGEAPPLATTATATPTATSTSVSTSTPTPTPSTAQWPGTPPSPIRGEARPAGRFLVTRDDGLWLVSLTNPSTDRRLYEATGPRWFFAGLAQTPSGSEVIVAEERQPNGPKEVHAMLFRIDLRGGVKTPLFEFGPVRGDFFPWKPAEVSPDGSRIAYAYGGGLYVRDRADEAGRLIFQRTTEQCGPSRPDCIYPMTPLWSPDGRSLVVTGINYEPVQTFLFDPGGATVRSGQRLPVCINDRVWRGSSNLGNNGNCYSGGESRFFWYDLSTKMTEDIRPPVGYEEGFAQVSNVSRNGEFAVTWAARQPSSRPADIVALYRADGTIFATTGSGARARQWVPDGSGVVLDSDGSIRFFFIDRAGDQWTLPLDATIVHTILPE